MNPTESAPVGGTALRVTRLGLGTAPLGGLFTPVATETAEATIEAAWNAGMRFFDTAPLYGHGLAETRLGRVLAGKPRDAFVLATKVGRLLRPPADGKVAASAYKDVPPLNPVFDFSYDGVMRSVDESLARLGLDRIDILHIHDPDHHYEAAISGAYRALARLRADGTIAAVGAGMNQWPMLQRFAEEGRFDCFLLAGRYTLLEQESAATFLPLCLERRIAIFIGGVYNSGLLANPTAGATYNYAEAPLDLVARAQRLDQICRAHGVPLKAAAIQFPAAQPPVASILTGARNPAELAENLAMARVAIPSALWRAFTAEGLIRAGTPMPG